MKVADFGNHNLQQIYQSQAERARQSSSAPQSTAGAGERNDAVELSSLAQLLQKVSQAAGREDPERLAQLARLRQQVQDNSYQAPVQQLATKLSWLLS